MIVTPIRDQHSDYFSTAAEDWKIYEGAPLTGNRLKTVLIVEDQQELNRSLALRFERAGIEARSAFDGVTALEKCANWEPDLILLDLGLPRMNGFKFLHQLRQESGTTPCPIIVMTGDSDPSKEERALRGGVVHYFHKPVSHRALVQASLDILAS